MYGHLSGRIVADAFKRYSRLMPGEQPIRQKPNLASDGVYTARRVAAAPVSSYLPFPSLQISLRSVSVALSLESPPPDVIRRPALRCSDFPHDRQAATRPYDQLGTCKYYTFFFMRCQSFTQATRKSILTRNTCFFAQNIIKYRCESFPFFGSLTLFVRLKLFLSEKVI